MHISHAYVVAMDTEWSHPQKAKGLARLQTDVQRHLGISLHAWPAFRATIEGPGDPSVPVTIRAAYGCKTRRLESKLDIGSAGAIGCATSHVHVLRHIGDTYGAGSGDLAANSWSAVFESDAVVGDKKGPALSRYLARHGQAIHGHGTQPCMVLLHTHGLPIAVPTRNRKPVKGIPGMFAFTDTFTGTCGFLVRNRDARRIADALLPLEVQVDGGYGILAYLGKIPPVWAAVPPLISAYNAQVTTVQTVQALKPQIPYRNTELGLLVILPWFLFFGAFAMVCVLYTGRLRV